MKEYKVVLKNLKQEVIVEYFLKTSTINKVLITNQIMVLFVKLVKMIKQILYLKDNVILTQIPKKMIKIYTTVKQIQKIVTTIMILYVVLNPTGHIILNLMNAMLVVNNISFMLKGNANNKNKC